MICEEHLGKGHVGKKAWFCCVGPEQKVCIDHIGKAKCCTILTYLIPVLLVIIVAIVPAMGGGRGAVTVSTPTPTPECFYYVEERYYEDTGEVIDRTEL